MTSMEKENRGKGQESRISLTACEVAPPIRVCGITA
jgi:hypothetical protein